MISHKHKFLFIHIPKNAGSSINNSIKSYCEFFKGNYKGKSLQPHLVPKDIPLGYGKHADDKIIRKLLKDEYKSYYKFCVVRNPWDRLVSVYWYELGNAIPRDWTFSKFLENYKELVVSSSREENAYRAVSWDYKNIMELLDQVEINGGEFISRESKALLKQNYNRDIVKEPIPHESSLWNGMKPQCEWISDKMNYIIKFEELNQYLLNDLYQVIGIGSTKLEHLNKRNHDKILSNSAGPDGEHIMKINSTIVHKNYRSMYKTDKQIEQVSLIYKEDIKRFGYEF